MQESFDKITTQYVINSLDGLNTATREQIISQLELQGVIGASELITYDNHKYDTIHFFKKNTKTDIVIKNINPYIIKFLPCL